MSGLLHAVVLVDNAEAEGLCSEWGLSIHVSYGNERVLLDFGQTDAFARNARMLGVDLAAVDHAVLSHAHYDHADGMDSFFAANDHAPLHLSAACAENCWSTKGGTIEPHYIGIHPGFLREHARRLSPVPTDRVTSIAPGIHLVPHTTPGLERLGERAGMLLREGNAWLPDGYAHETSLVFELGDGADAPVAVFNSCSHAGVEAIVAEVRGAFPNRDIAAFLGGLHLMRSDDEAILEVARAIQGAGIAHVYTGHCTGDRALELLSQELPGRVTTLRPGLHISL